MVGISDGDEEQCLQGVVGLPEERHGRVRHVYGEGEGDDCRCPEALGVLLGKIQHRGEYQL